MMNLLRALALGIAEVNTILRQPWYGAADDMWDRATTRDGADRLAEREAEEEVTEPFSEWADESHDLAEQFLPAACECGGIRGIWHDFDCDTSNTCPTPGSPLGSCCSEGGVSDTTGSAPGVGQPTPAAPDIRSSVDAADGPRGTAAQPETRAGHPNPH